MYGGKRHSWGGGGAGINWRDPPARKQAITTGETHWPQKTIGNCFPTLLVLVRRGIGYVWSASREKPRRQAAEFLHFPQIVSGLDRSGEH